MSRIRFDSRSESFASAGDSLVVIAPKRRFERGPLPEMGADALEWVRLLAKETSPGDLGSSAATFTRGKPKRICVGVLPNEVSRHNSPARAEMIRKVAASAGLGARGDHGVAILLDEPTHALAAANALYRALPTFHRRSKRDESGEVRFALFDAGGKSVKLDKGDIAVCEGTREMAHLVDMPPTELDPAALSKAARAFLKGIPRIAIREIAGDALLRAKLRGVWSVGKAAVTAPRVLIASYSPRGAAKKHIALVGKGVTYDTGGLSLKSSAHMIGMKGDMGGAAAMLGAFRALAVAGCSHRLTLVLCMAENAIGPKSYKNDDILTLHSGKTVEINNTDAEGRLLLADGVSYAARELGATTILDAATLTGAQLVATGLLHAGIVSNDEALERLIVESGRDSGDLCHALPFAPEFFKQEFKSTVADMRNSVKDRNNAPSSCGAQFVYSQIDELKGIRFGHIDLAGPAFPADRATGFGVALVYKTVLGL